MDLKKVHPQHYYNDKTWQTKNANYWIQIFKKNYVLFKTLQYIMYNLV